MSDREKDDILWGVLTYAVYEMAPARRQKKAAADARAREKDSKSKGALKGRKSRAGAETESDGEDTDGGRENPPTTDEDTIQKDLFGDSEPIPQDDLLSNLGADRETLQSSERPVARSVQPSPLEILNLAHEIAQQQS